MGRYRFLISPGWVVRHVIALLLAVVLVNLGLWQLRRLDQRRTHNAELAARAAAPVVDVGAAQPSGDPADLAYREAVASGSYRSDQEVFVRSRSLDGAPGAWVLTPLVLGDGRAVVVNRGWIPASGPPVLPEEARAPTGPVQVRGLLMPSEQRGSFGPRDPASGTLTALARADLARLQAQVPEQLYALYIQLDAQQPPLSAGLPALVPPPERSEGPHLSYAIQWFSFATMGLVAYGLLIRKIARQRAGESGGGAAAGAGEHSAAEASEERAAGETSTGSATAPGHGRAAAASPGSGQGVGPGRADAPALAERSRRSE